MANRIHKVSIGMPVYNGAKYIRKALDSLLSQDYGNFELIISDNGSTDNTQDICLAYAARDKRVCYYRSDTNKGSVWNFIRVFEQGSGEYFMLAGHDDYWQPAYLSTCLNGFDKSDKVILSGAMCESINPDGGKTIFIDRGFSTVGLKPADRFKRYKSTTHGGNHVGGIFFGLYKRDRLKKIMPPKRVIANDHLILAELCFHGEFITVPSRLMTKRQGGASRTNRDIARALGITNPILIWFPYLVREFFMQKLIFSSDNLLPSEKFKLSLWSFGQYLRIWSVWASRCIYVMPFVFIKRFIVRRIRRYSKIQEERVGVY